MKQRLVSFVTSLGVSTAVAVVALVLLEVFLRVAAPQTERWDALGGEGIAVRDEKLGRRYRPGSRARNIAPEYDVVYEINRHGQRDATPWESTRDTTRTRVLVLGDSFAFGHGVDYDSTWVVRMESDLDEQGVAVDVVNAGVQGYDTRTEWLYLRELIDDVRPDVVLVAFLPNDIYTNEYPDSVRADMPSRKRMPQLQVVELAKRILLRNDMVYARMFLRTARRAYYLSDPGPATLRSIDATKACFDRIVQLCDEKSVRLVVLSIPQQFQVIVRADGFRFPGIDVDGIDNRFVAYADGQGFRWYPVLQEMADAAVRDGAPLYFRIDGHLTPAGNRELGDIAARMLAPVISANSP